MNERLYAGKHEFRTGPLVFDPKAFNKEMYEDLFAPDSKWFFVQALTNISGGASFPSTSASARAFGDTERRTQGRKTQVVSRRKVIVEGKRGTILSLACGHFKFVQTDRGGDALCFLCPPLERKKKR